MFTFSLKNLVNNISKLGLPLLWGISTFGAMTTGAIISTENYTNNLNLSDYDYYSTNHTDTNLPSFFSDISFRYFIFSDANSDYTDTLLLAGTSFFIYFNFIGD
jgi:hypothetical protein